MSRDLGRDVPDLEKLYARKLWADFSYPTEDNVQRGQMEGATPTYTPEEIVTQDDVHGGTMHEDHEEVTATDAGAFSTIQETSLMRVHSTV